MSIQVKTEYDVSSGRVVGAVTLPGHNGIATHALVSMLSGLPVRWKQAVAYYSQVCLMQYGQPLLCLSLSASFDLLALSNPKSTGITCGSRSFGFGQTSAEAEVAGSTPAMTPMVLLVFYSLA